MRDKSLIYIAIILGSLYCLSLLTRSNVSDAAPAPRGLWVEPLGRGTLTGIVHNDNLFDYTFVEVRYPLYDGSGNLLGYASDTIAGLPAGQTWRYEAHTFGVEASRCGQPELFTRS